MRYFFTLILLTSFCITQAQNPIFTEPDKDDADSLLAIVRNPPNDTLEMVSCRGLALYYLDVNIDSSKYYSNRDLELARKLGLRLWEADALDMNSIAQNRSSDYSKSLEYFMQAVEIASDPKTEKNIWRMTAFTPSGNPSYARKNMLATIYLDLGNLYVETNFHDKAITTYSKSLALAKEIGDYTVPSIAYGFIADSYTALNKLDSARILIRIGLSYGDSARYYKYRGSDYNRLGTIAMLQGNIPESKSYFLQGLKWQIEQKNLVGEAETYLNLSESYYAEGNLDSSYFYAQKGLRANLNSVFEDRILQSYELLYIIHNATNQKDSAFYYLERSKILGDRINAEERIKQFQNIGFEEQLRMREFEAAEEDFSNRLRMNALLGSSFTLIVIAFLLYRNNRVQKRSKRKTEIAYDRLKNTQAQLIHSEKMASLGELTAGIAHEIQNPLNFVNNFSDVNKELVDELREEMKNGNTQEAEAILKDIEENEQKIMHHGQRADTIVKGMLQHSRAGGGEKEPTNINELADEYLRLAYHGLRAKDKSFNANFKTELDPDLPKINVVPQDIGRVLLNLINNAFYAVSKKHEAGSSDYKPEVVISTEWVGSPLGAGGSVEISIKDNGSGIPDSIKDKIFQPFFTTKATGQGTGLGLSLSYDIVTKGHGGELKVEDLKKGGTVFIIELPFQSQGA